MSDTAFGPLVILGDDDENPARVGDELTARPNSVVPAEDWAKLEAGSESFQWNRDNKAIKGATDQQYIIQEADAGHALTVTYDFVFDGEEESVTNKDVVNVPLEKEPYLGDYAPLDVALYSSHLVVYGYAPTKTTLDQLRKEYKDKGKALSDIVRNMENKAADK